MGWRVDSFWLSSSFPRVFSLFFLPCSHLLLVQVLFSCLLLSSIQQTVSDNYPPFSPINLAFSSLSIHAKAWSSLRFTFEPQTVHATFYTVLLPPHLHFCYQQHLVVPVQVHPQAEERQSVGSVSLNSSIMSTLETVSFFLVHLGPTARHLVMLRPQLLRQQLHLMWIKHLAMWSIKKQQMELCMISFKCMWKNRCFEECYDFPWTRQIFSLAALNGLCIVLKLNNVNTNIYKIYMIDWWW